LATSLVRQWLTNDGHAGLVTPTQQHWFQLVAEGDYLEVRVSTAEGDWGRALSRHWGVDEAEVPGLLHRLNLCQSVLSRIMHTLDRPEGGHERNMMGPQNFRVSATAEPRSRLPRSARLERFPAARVRQ
jgi:hypothetical protein